MKILGLDPGTTRIGYGLIESRPGLKLINYGVIEVRAKTETGKLLELGDRLTRIIADYRPDWAGVEKLYFAKNQKTALAVSQARGVMIYLLMKNKIPVYECRPADVKKAVTGYGFADKKAVAKMVKIILGVTAITGPDDASDALAIAITTANNCKNYNEPPDCNH